MPLMATAFPSAVMPLAVSSEAREVSGAHCIGFSLMVTVVIVIWIKEREPGFGPAPLGFYSLLFRLFCVCCR